MPLLSSRLQRIQPSPTLAINARAIEMKSQNLDIINLSAGEPDFDTPDHIKQAAINAILQGQTKYTPVDGTQNLKQAIVNKFKRDQNLDYTLNEVTVGSGGKQVIFNAFLATIDDGDEVIIPAPYWVSYPEMVSFCGGKPKIILATHESHFKITHEQLENAMSSNTKWVIINSPSNPTGMAYTKDELLALADVLRKHPHVHILSDDIYEHLLFDDLEFFTLAQIAPDLKNRILIVNGASKSYSMTGWRIGYAAGPQSLIRAMGIIQSQSTSNACSISQAAAAEALNGDQSFLESWRKSFAARRDLVVDGLSKIAELDVIKPHGAFYLYVGCKALLGKVTPTRKLISSDIDVAEYLLEEAHVAAVPGSAFGLPPYFRISYAIAPEKLELAITRIKKAIDLLSAS